MRLAPHHGFPGTQRGLSLSGLIFLLAIAGALFVFGAKVFPTFVEYRAIKDSIAAAKAAGGTVREMQIAFDKGADINGVTTITAKDLVISKETGELEISFAYEKRIPLAGNVSLLIDYSGTTDKTGKVAVKEAPTAL